MPLAGKSDSVLHISTFVNCNRSWRLMALASVWAYQNIALAIDLPPYRKPSTPMDLDLVMEAKSHVADTRIQVQTN